MDALNGTGDNASEYAHDPQNGVFARGNFEKVSV